MALGDTINLEYKMKKGESLEYKTTVESEQSMQEGDQPAMGGSSVMEMVMQQTATDVTGDGVMAVDVTIQSVSMKQNGEAASMPEGSDPSGKKVSMRMKKSGEVVQTSMDLPFSQPPFPTRSLRKGETWKGDSHIPVPVLNDAGEQTGTRQVTLTYHYSLWDFRRVGGYECAEINVSCPETTIPLRDKVDQRISAKGTTYFAWREGRLVRSEVETTSSINAPDVAIKNHIKVRVELTNASSAAAPAPAQLSGGAEEEFIIGH
ncbi:MAG TPA: hypothetical protein VGO93_07635 [Candidatus Xenobia bacterium]|jgi:hypothetical protein